MWERIYWYKVGIVRRISIIIMRFFYEEILVLGDSHASVFWHKTFNKSFKGYFFNVVAVAGATISGLNNPNSNTQALSEYLSKLDDSKARIVIVMLGEVDTGFVIWYRAEKYKLSVSEMADLALHNYQILLEDIKKRFTVICVSTPLPTIQDDNDVGEIANIRKQIKATQVQRTILTLMFNKEMQSYCQKNSIFYMMLDDETLGKDGLVKNDMLSQDPKDHHYDKDNYSSLLIEKLKGIIKPHEASTPTAK